MKNALQLEKSLKTAVALIYNHFFKLLKALRAAFLASS